MPSKSKRTSSQEVASSSTEIHHTKRKGRLHSKRKRAIHDQKDEYPTDNSPQASTTTTLQASCTPPPQQTIDDDDGVTSTAPSNPNPEVPDSQHSATNMPTAMSVSSSLPSSNTITTSTSISTTDDVVSVSSTSSSPLQQSNVGESDQAGMSCTMLSDPSGTRPTNPHQPEPREYSVEEGTVSVKPDMDQQIQPVQVMPSWRQDVSPDLRQHLVRKLVTTINPVQDQDAQQDESLMQYAKDIEENMFELAQSREQYYELLAEKIYKLQKELEEKRKIPAQYDLL